MKEIKNILAAFIIFTWGFSSFAQVSEYRTASEFEVKTAGMSNEKSQQLTQNSRNTVLIQQVGNRNAVHSNITSRTNQLEIDQRGNNNYVGIRARMDNLNQRIVQHGDNNRAFDFMYGPQNDAGLHLIQNGNNSHFARHGTNSIGNNITLKMSGDNSAVIVRNFK